MKLTLADQLRAAFARLGVPIPQELDKMAAAPSSEPPAPSPSAPLAA